VLADAASHADFISGKVGNYSRVIFNRILSNDQEIIPQRAFRCSVWGKNPAPPAQFLLFEDKRRTTDPVGYEIDCHFNAVGNFNEWNTTIHAVVLPVEGHRPFDLA
jgi:hypothetical protein